MSDNYRIEPVTTLKGTLEVSGDKSISHRALILASIAEGTTHITGFLEGYDCLATLRAIKALGVKIEGPYEGGVVIVHGVTKRGLKTPTEPLNLANSETSTRMLTGLLAGAGITAELTGESSLLAHPIDRVVLPLRSMGASITLSPDDTPPVHIQGGRRLRGIDYAIPVASSQVKSALLLAGLYARGVTHVVEPEQTRDHTERMLQSFGYPIEKRDHGLTVTNEGRLIATHIHVPGDISTAAYFMVGASIAAQSNILIKGVGINPTRMGVIHILRAMGADIELSKTKIIGAEPVADIRVKSAPLHGIDIPQEWVTSAIDTFPALFIAAACAKGRTTLSGAGELRRKKSDRINTMAEGLTTLGIHAEPHAEGITIEGGTLKGGTVKSYGDHRIAMAFTMASLGSQDTINLVDCAPISLYFPQFINIANQAGMNISPYESQ